MALTRLCRKVVVGGRFDWANNGGTPGLKTAQYRREPFRGIVAKVQDWWIFHIWIPNSIFAPMEGTAGRVHYFKGSFQAKVSCWTLYGKVGRTFRSRSRQVVLGWRRHEENSQDTQYLSWMEISKVVYIGKRDWLATLSIGKNHLVTQKSFITELCIHFYCYVTKTAFQFMLQSTPVVGHCDAHFQMDFAPCVHLEKYTLKTFSTAS